MMRPPGRGMASASMPLILTIMAALLAVGALAEGVTPPEALELREEVTSVDVVLLSSMNHISVKN